MQIDPHGKWALGIGFVLIAVTLGVAPVAHAYDSSQARYQGRSNPNMRSRLSIRGTIGFGGTAKIDQLGGKQDLTRSYGGALEIDTPIIPLLSLGGEFAALGWRTQPAQSFHFDRNVLMDFSLVPKLRLPFNGESVFGAFYVGMPVGLTLDVLDQSYDQALNLAGANVKTGYGYNIGGRVGLEIFPSPRVGITGEVGYRYHWIHHGANGPLGTSGGVKMKLQQLMVHAGLVFLL